MTDRMTHATPNFEEVDKLDEGLGGDYPSIIQQCYNARRDLPRALGEWIASGARTCNSWEFARRLNVAARISKSFTTFDQMSRYRFYALQGSGARP